MPGDAFNHYDQGRFEGQVIERLDQLKAVGERVERCLDRHAERLSYLEKQDTKIKAYCTAISIAVSAILHYLMKVWKA